MLDLSGPAAITPAAVATPAAATTAAAAARAAVAAAAGDAAALMVCSRAGLHGPATAPLAVLLLLRVRPAARAGLELMLPCRPRFSCCASAKTAPQLPDERFTATGVRAHHAGMSAAAESHGFSGRAQHTRSSSLAASMAALTAAAAAPCSLAPRQPRRNGDRVGAALDRQRPALTRVIVGLRLELCLFT